MIVKLRVQKQGQDKPGPMCVLNLADSKPIGAQLSFIAQKAKVPLPEMCNYKLYDFTENEIHGEVGVGDTLNSRSLGTGSLLLLKVCSAGEGLKASSGDGEDSSEYTTDATETDTSTGTDSKLKKHISESSEHRGYSVYHDPRNGRNYFFPTGSSMRDLKNVYQQVKDSKSGKFYYINAKSKQSSWSLPKTEPPVVEEKPAEGVSEPEPKRESAGRQEDIKKPEQAQTGEQGGEQGGEQTGGEEKKPEGTTGEVTTGEVGGQEGGDAVKQDAADVPVDTPAAKPAGADQAAAAAEIARQQREKADARIEAKKLAEEERAMLDAEKDDAAVVFDSSSGVTNFTNSFFDGFNDPKGALKRGETEREVERQCFLKEGSGEIRCVCARPVKQALGSKKKREDRVMAICRDWTGAFAAFLLSASGWRSNKYSVLQMFPITDSISIERGKSDTNSVIFIDEERVDIETADVETRQAIGTALKFALNAMYENRSLADQWMMRLRSVEFATYYREKEADVAYVEDLVQKITIAKLMDVGRAELILELRKFLFIPSVRDHVFDLVFKILESRNPPRLWQVASLMIFEASFRYCCRPTKDRNYSTKFERCVAPLASSDDEGLAVRAEGILEDYRNLCACCEELKDRMADEDVPFENTFGLKPEDYVFGDAEHEKVLGARYPSNSLILTTLFFTNDGKVLLDHNNNLPHAFVASYPDLTETSEDFQWLMSFAPTEMPSTTLPSPSIRQSICAAFENLRDLLGNTDLGLIYDRPIYLKSIRSTMLLTVRRFREPFGLPMPAKDNYDWHETPLFEHRFYQKHMDLPLITRLSTLPATFYGPRFVSAAVSWRMRHRCFNALRPGLYLGSLVTLSDLEGLHVLTRDRVRDLPVSVLVDKTLPSGEEEKWIRSLRLRAAKGLAALTEGDDTRGKDLAELTFKQRFARALDSLKMQVEVGELYDVEIIPLNETGTAKMVLYVSNVTDRDGYEKFIWRKAGIFDLHFFHGHFPKLFRIQAQRVREAKEKIEMIRVSMANFDSPEEFDAQNEALVSSSKELQRRERAWSSLRYVPRSVAWNQMLPEVDESLPFNEALRVVLERQDEAMVRVRQCYSIVVKETYRQLAPDWSRIEKELEELWRGWEIDKHFVEEEEDVAFVPQLRPLDQIRETLPPTETFSVEFTLHQLLDYVTYEPTPHEYCRCLVDEVVEGALVEAVDVAELAEVESCISEMVTLVELAREMVEDVSLLVAERESRERLEKEKSIFSEKLFQIYSQPLPEYPKVRMDENLLSMAAETIAIEGPQQLDALLEHPEECEPETIKQLRKVAKLSQNALDLLKTPYTDSIRTLVSQFSSLVDTSERIVSILDCLHDVEETVSLVQELNEEAKEVQRRRDKKREERKRRAAEKKKLHMRSQLPEEDKPRQTEYLRKSSRGTTKKHPIALKKQIKQLQQDRKRSEVKEAVISLPELLIHEALTDRVVEEETAKVEELKIVPTLTHELEKEPAKPRLSVRTKRYVSGLRRLNEMYRGVNESQDSGVVLSHGGVVQTRNDSISTWLIEGDEYEIPPALLVHCLAQLPTRVELPFSAAAMEVVLTYLSNPSGPTSFSNLEAEVAAAAEALQIPELLIYALDCLSISEDVSEVLYDSFLLKLDLPKLVSLEKSTQSPLFDMLWYSLALPFNPPSYAQHRGGWAYVTASYVVGASLPELSDLESLTAIGERVFALSGDITDKAAAVLVHLCPNLMRIDAHDSRLGDRGLAELLQLGLLESLDIRGTAVSEAGVKRAMHGNRGVEFKHSY